MNIHKKLKIWKQTVTYLAVTFAFISFTESLFAGWIYDGNDEGNNRRLVRVVFGTNTNTLPNPPLCHPDASRTANQFDCNDVNVNMGAYMRNTLPAINTVTHIEFWINPTVLKHRIDAFFAELGAQANAYINSAPYNILTFQIIDK